MKRRGFTLVELLAVIAILAILVIIALPNVMNLFNRAKQNAFETEIKEIYKTAQQQWIADSMFNTQSRTYAKCSSETCPNKLDMSGRSELEYYIKLDKSGNVVRFYATDGTYQYSYKGNGLKVENISNIEQVSKIDEEEIIEISCSGIDKVIYPDGKDKSSVVTGDIVKIDTEEFYVIKHDGEDLILLSHYNLNVGIFKYNQSPEGIQSEKALGRTNDSNIGIVGFGGHYWENNVGEGLKYQGSYSHPNYPFVYDNNSKLYEYVENYKEYLESKGVEIKEARIMSYQEAYELGCVYNDCSNAPDFVIETSYYLGSAYNFGNIWMLFGSSCSLTYGASDYIFNFGVRPVIVI